LPWIVTTNGNQLHVVYEDDFQRIWYTSRTVPGLPIPAQAIPTLLPVASASPGVPDELAAVSAAPTPDLRGLSPIIGAPATPRDTFLLGLAPVGLIVGLVVIGRLLQRLRE
jgi:hypothetical protein